MNPLGPIGVFIFLFCSGYGLQQSYKISGTKRYFGKKLVKAYIPFLVSILLFCVFTKILKLHVDINILSLCFLSIYLKALSGTCGYNFIGILLSGF